MKKKDTANMEVRQGGDRRWVEGRSWTSERKGAREKSEKSEKRTGSWTSVSGTWKVRGHVDDAEKRRVTPRGS